MSSADSLDPVIGLDLDEDHQQVRLVAPSCPCGMKFALEWEIEDAAGDALDLQLRITAASSCADSSTDSSTATNGSSYSMLIVPLKPRSRSKATNRPHHSRS